MNLKFLLCLFCLCGTLFAYPSYPPQLTVPMRALYQNKESQQLLSQAESEGPLTIKMASLGAQASNAVWLPDERTICLNVSKKRSLGSLICSMIFELHNATTTKQFNHTDQLAASGRLSKQKYIETIERIEYANALKTSQMLERGVRKGVFPADARYPIAPTFEEHYAIQIQYGHSQFIGRMYENLICQSQNTNRMNYRNG